MISAFERRRSSHSAICGGRSSVRRVAGVVVAACALLTGTAARAEDAETRTAARDLAMRGAEAFDAGKYAEAADFFGRAQDLVHAPSIGIMRARSLAKLGRLVEAIDTYEQTARFKLEYAAPDAYVKAVHAARAEVEDVRARVPRVKITLYGAGANEASVVTIDDKPTPAALLGVERPLDPGPHRLAVRVGSETRSTRALTVEERQTYSVELDAAPHGNAAMPAAGPVGAEPQPAENKLLASSPGPRGPDAGKASSSARTLGYLGLGIGALGLGIGTYTGLVALRDKSRLDEACHPQCPASSADDLSGFRANRTLSWVSYGVGIAGVATGVVLLTIGNPKHEHAALGVWPGGVQIGGKL